MKILKTKHADFNDMEFAFLIEPDERITSDDELYAAVRAHGKAVIQPFQSGYRINNPVTLTPQEFEAKWRGD